MRIERVTGPARSRGTTPPRRAVTGPVPKVSRHDEPDPSGPSARRDSRPINPVVWLACSICASGVLFAFFLLGDKGLLQERRHIQRVADLQAEVSSLYQESERLEADVSSLKNDPAAAEKIAREELNLVRPGDVVLILPKGWQEQAERAARLGGDAPATPSPAPPAAAAAAQSPAPSPAPPTR